MSVAVLDVGKTNVKLATFDAAGALLWERSRANAAVPGPPYPHADVEGIAAFLIEALRVSNQAHAIGAIVATTHGCAGAFIDADGLTLPVLDYEFTGLDEFDADYAKMRPPFAQTLSPALPIGLNQGRQVAWQMRRFPAETARAKHYLAYPQYWAWRLSGIAASEYTMWGAHSDLWAPRERKPSPLAEHLGLTRMLPPFQRAYAALGPIKPEIAAATGLTPDVRVLCGAHDSNASLLPHLAARKPPFTVVSTGTWVILMSPGLAIEGLRESDDMLANVDVEGRPVACARFMGGREYAELVRGDRSAPDTEALARILAAGTLALPCFGGQGGPFVARTGEIRGALADADRPALATLYLAEMTDLMVTRLGAATGDLIVEGSFAANALFCGLLAALRPNQNVIAGDDSAGTARGAAMLADWPPMRASAGHVVAPLALQGLEAHRRTWAAAVERS